MEELKLGTLMAVFQEMLGTGLYWFMILAVILVTLGYVFVLVRDKSLSMKKFFWAQVTMPFGALAAIVFTLWVTNSHLLDIGGPIDVIVFLGIAALGAVGTSIFVYTVESFIWPPKI